LLGSQSIWKGTRTGFIFVCCMSQCLSQFFEPGQHAMHYRSKQAHLAPSIVLAMQELVHTSSPLVTSLYYPITFFYHV
jgi:hypothetical protein